MIYFLGLFCYLRCRELHLRLPRLHLHPHRQAVQHGAPLVIDAGGGILRKRNFLLYVAGIFFQLSDFCVQLAKSLLLRAQVLLELLELVKHLSFQLFCFFNVFIQIVSNEHLLDFWFERGDTVIVVLHHL